MFWNTGNTILRVLKDIYLFLDTHNQPFLLFTLFYLFFSPESIKSQEIKIVRVDDFNYPEMELTFIATFPNGEKNFSLEVKDFEIEENDKKANVIEVINPSGEGAPVSVVLVFDISTSMRNERLVLAQDAAIEFLNKFPLETSEVAIASFSNKVYVNCDFTQDGNRLKDAIKALVPDGGTDYSRAFLFSQTGALDIARKGRYKKAIVFLTDGQSSANETEIIKQAQQEGITVYCITMALRMPEILKNIATQTGGRYYEAITNIYQLHNFYASIGQLLQTSGYSILRWRAPEGCERKRKVKLMCHNFPVEFTYDIPYYKLGYLEPDPGKLFFGDNPESNSSSLTLSLTARNQAISILGISNSMKNYFSVGDTLKFPFQIWENETRRLNIQYHKQEAGIFSDKLTITTLGCPSLQIDINGGIEEQLRLISPTGGEVFPVGMDTAIVWEGIKRNKDISLWYRTAENKPWKSITETQGLYYAWKVPNDTSSHVQVKVEPLLNDNRDFRVSNRFASNFAISDVYINADGSYILTVDKSGMVRMLNGNSSKILVSLGGFGIKHAILSSDSRRIIGFTGFEMFVWDVVSLKLVARYTYRQKLYVSDVDPEGEETLLSTRIYKDINEKTKVWSPGSNVLIPIPEKKDVTSATMSANGLKAITLNANGMLKIWNLSDNTDIANIKIKPEVVSVVIGPNGKTFVVAEQTQLKVYSMDNGKELFNPGHAVYKKFSSNGQILITSDGYTSINFWDINKGQSVFNLFHPVFYKMASTTNSLLYYSSDTITFKDLSGKVADYKIFDNQLSDALISPGGNTLVLVRKNNTIDFYDTYDRKRINTLNEFDSPIVKVKYSSDGKNLMVVMENSEIMLFKPYINKKLHEVVSGKFSIVAPKPEVMDTVWFNQGNIFTRSEKTIDGFVCNKFRFPVVVSGMEISKSDTGVFGIVSDTPTSLLQPNTCKSVELSFTPNKMGACKGKLYTYTATDTFTTVLLGTGIKSNLEILSENVDFGKVKVNSVRDTVVAVLKNTGNEEIIISEVINTSSNKQIFEVKWFQNNQTLKPEDTLFLSLRFMPQYRGRISGSLIVNMKSGQSEQPISLLGEGVASQEVWLCGRTLNSLSNSPVAATLKCIDLFSGTVVRKQTTDTSGKFKIQLNADRNYGITAEKENFIAGSENVNLTGPVFADTIYRDIFLTEIRTGAMIRLNCVFFDYARWDLLPVSKSELDRLAETLKKYTKISIEIHGHTDSIGSNEANLLLSKNRANAVRSYLIKRGISANRLFVLYFGETIPVTSNASDDGRARNRRVEVKVK